MKQIVQLLKTGETILEEIPAPRLVPGNILIQTSRSLVSAGTEKMLVEFSKANLIEKSRQQPERVKQVFDKIKSDGLIPTLEAVFSKLDQPLPMGYCNVGKIIDIGQDVTEFKIGDRVVSNGAHAEVVSIPKNLVAAIPDKVTDDEATFTIIGSIGLQGVRLINPTLGETIVVFGLGLIGLITCQILKANGCRVIGLDIDQKKCEIAKKWGIHSINVVKNDSVNAVKDYTRKIGVDGVIITASSKADKIVSQAASMCRKKGRIVLVGVVGLNFNRADFYEKELSFQVSCSYGPGRYDNNYEKKGVDYPLPYVRWTEKRNFETVLELIKNGLLDVKDLISEKVALKQYLKIYNNISSNESIASILTYNDEKMSEILSDTIFIEQRTIEKQKGTVAIIGAGNFTKSTVLPILKNLKTKVKYIVSNSGLNGTQLAKKYGISASTTNYHKTLDDRDVDTVIITTRHNTHSKIVIDSLKKGKNVLVEKPLSIKGEELNQIIDLLLNQKPKHLLVGFNRRFSAHSRSIKNALGEAGPVNIIANMNAGEIPLDHWVNDFEEGGGRIIGEACHLIDLCVFLTGSLVNSVCFNAFGNKPALNVDSGSILLKFQNGSNASINYFANGARNYSKERIEVYSQKKTWVIDNFRTTTGFGDANFKNLKTKQDKGHRNQLKLFLNQIRSGGPPLIKFKEIVNVTKTSIGAIESLKETKWVKIN